MTDRQKTMYEALINLGCTEAVNILLNVHGYKLLNDDLYDELTDNGIFESDDDEEEEMEND